MQVNLTLFGKEAGLHGAFIRAELFIRINTVLILTNFKESVTFKYL